MSRNVPTRRNNQTRPTRLSNVPPHLRTNNTTTLQFVHYPSPPRGRGRGRGHGRGGGRPYPSASQNHDPFTDLTEKFYELEVIDDGNNNNSATVINFDAYEEIPVEATGKDIPEPVNTFSDIDLGAGLNENIKRCKYVKPTPIQKYAIPIVVAGRDLMACAQTGSGKTAAFCFPIISGILMKNNNFKMVGSGRRTTRMAYPSALILSPTRELSCQIHEEAKKFAFNTGLKIVVAYGGAPIVQQLRNLEKGVDILVATPGRLLDLLERGRVYLRMINYLALDEADRMLDMGFEPQIRKIVEQMDMPPPGQRQTMLFSATFPREIQRLASDFLLDYIFVTVGRVGSSTDLIAQRVELVQDIDKRSHLMDLLRSQKPNGIYGKYALTLVFVETKRGADGLEHWLSGNGFPAVAIHGDKVQVERERALRSFKSGATPILVATDVASRGLDIPHVSHVINFDLPKDIDSYVHRIGRTGRAGKSGLATAFFSDKNMHLAKALVELMKEANQEVPSWLSEYAENSSYGQTKQYGGSKFGACDFRNDASDIQSGSDNYYYSTYGGAGSVGGSYASPPGSFDYGVPANANYYAAATADSYFVGSHEFGLGYDSVEASGWD